MPKPSTATSEWADLTATAAPDPTGVGCLVIVARHHGLHLTAAQLVRDNLLSRGEISGQQIVKCARTAGLKASSVRLTANRVSKIAKALPTIVTLKNGAYMVLRG